MTKFGLNGFLERTKGASLRYKLREFWWQLRYAWQRAWRGYDFTDVFELGYNFTAKMPVLLTEFLKTMSACSTMSKQINSLMRKKQMRLSRR